MYKCKAQLWKWISKDFLNNQTSEGFNNISKRRKNTLNNNNVPSQSNTETLYYQHAKHIVKKHSCKNSIVILLTDTWIYATLHEATSVEWWKMNQVGNLTTNREKERINSSVKVEYGMEFFSINIYGSSDDHDSAWWPSKQKIIRLWYFLPSCGGKSCPGAWLPVFCLRLCTTSSPLQALGLQPGGRLGCVG